MKKVAFTTTIPQEYIWAASAIPVDLNNLFILGQSKKFIISGEKHGVTRNTCSWIKGLMGAVVEYEEEFDTIIAVTEGDCSNNHGLVNLCQHFMPSLKVVSFAYPADRDERKLRYELDKLGEHFGVSYEQAMEIKEKLDLVRERLRVLDILFYQKKNVSATEFQRLMVASSDFGSNVEVYSNKIEELIKLAETSQSNVHPISIGYMGVPTIISNLFGYLEDELGVKLSYFEVENDFAMLQESKDLIEQYQNFNYPYELNRRIIEVEKQIKQRNLKGIIHYAQAFCHRQLDDIIIKNRLSVPVLTIEGDAPGELDMRTKIRIECFVERLKEA